MGTTTITYKDMVMRFGKPNAKDLLLCIEKLAKIKDSIVDIDAEKRLQKALDALDKV